MTKYQTVTPIPGRDRKAQPEWSRGFQAGIEAGAVAADYDAALRSGAGWESMRGDELRFVRKERFRESLEDFARRTGIPARTLQRYETGESPVPAWCNLVIAAVLYGLPPYPGEPK